MESTKALHESVYMYIIHVRRLAWVICVIGAIIIFTVQVGLRTSDFFAYSTTVDVQLTYTDQVKFPAVSLCNQNSFR